jgi:uncharacterized protein YcbX
MFSPQFGNRVPLLLDEVAGITDLVASPVDVRRFRANIVIATEGNTPFLEDKWGDDLLLFGTPATAPGFG